MDTATVGTIDQLSEVCVARGDPCKDFRIGTKAFARTVELRRLLDQQRLQFVVQA
jgi:hypothetical protein